MSGDFVYSPKEKRALFSCPLFGEGEDLAAALALLEAVPVRYAKGEVLLERGAPVLHFGLVLSGRVEGYRDDIDGNQVMLTHVSPGETFGESLCFLRREKSPLYIQAAEDTAVLWLKTDALMAPSPSPLALLLFRRFTGMLAERALAMNGRIQILSRKTLREKLLFFLAGCRREAGEGTFSIPFDREKLAIYLGVNRSALSRELSKLQKEGVLTYYKNTFRLE